MTKRSSPAGSGRGRRGASERRVQSRSTPSEAKPESICTAAHLRPRSLNIVSLSGSYRSWDLYTTGQLVDGLQQKKKKKKKENRFSLSLDAF